MAWLGNFAVVLAFVGLIPNTISYVALEPPPLTVEEKILAELPPVFLEIAQCESNNNQNAVSHTGDYGYFQINEWHWDKVAQEKGLDYKNNFDDNLAMAVHIYKVQGLKAWVCAKKLGYA